MKLGDFMRPDEESAFRLGAEYALVEVVRARYYYGLVVKQQRRWRLVRRIGSAQSLIQRRPYYHFGLPIVTGRRSFPPRLLTAEEQEKFLATEKARAGEKKRRTAAAALKRWQRKAKLAATKVKQYTRLVRRLGVATC